MILLNCQKKDVDFMNNATKKTNDGCMTYRLDKLIKCTYLYERSLTFGGKARSFFTQIILEIVSLESFYK